MIRKGSFLVPADKCGVHWVRVFHLYYGFSRKLAFTGDFVKVSVRKARARNFLKKKAKVRGILIRLKKESYKIDGSTVKFFINNVVLVKRRLTPRGKELFGPILRKIRRKKFRSSFPGAI